MKKYDCKKDAWRQYDSMTPLERKREIEAGRDVDRLPCVPFMGELKCKYSGVSVWDFSHNPEKMAEAELKVFQMFGYDRIVIGPNTRGISEALGAEFGYPEQGVPFAERAMIESWDILNSMEPVRAKQNDRMKIFEVEADMLMDSLGDIVPLEMSIGGPFTIASILRGIELLLRDCRKEQESVHSLLRMITDSQKSCIDLAAEYGYGIAMADPVANPALIGPRMYKEYVFPYTKELTEYAQKKTGYKVSLHMCGKTYAIWEYLRQYPLNELSLDNTIDLERAVEELGAYIPIAGNVDPVSVILNGTKEEIFKATKRCMDIGSKADKGYIVAPGCDIPETTEARQVRFFMDAVRKG